MGYLSRYAGEFRINVQEILDAIAEVKAKKDKERVKAEAELEEA